MLENILSISGKPGLYKLLTQAKATIIVESLVDGNRMPVSSNARVSALQEISMYTVGGDVRLSHVMANIYKLTNGKPCIDSKASNEELKDFMAKALPEWDSERVHVSDIKKLVSWFNILLAKGLVSDKEDNEEEAAAAVEEKKEEKADKKEEKAEPKKRTTKKKAEGEEKEEKGEKGEKTEEKAAKKTTKKSTKKAE